MEALFARVCWGRYWDIGRFSGVKEELSFPAAAGVKPMLDGAVRERDPRDLTAC
jgi:hypothetical protein